ncbi:MAG: sugar ABC transporter permease [Clostridia bacterium]|nr:sugar ABC transporter permease [Clostridia bacterium]
MKRNTIATGLLLAFIVCFVLSGVTAVSTAKDVVVSTTVSHLASVYSLSSAAVLILPFIMVFMVLALFSFLAKQKNVGFMFTALSVVCYVAFLIAYCSETRNNSMFNTLNAMFQEQGVRVKKRDFFITVTPQWTCYLTAILGLATCAVSLPDLRTSTTRYSLKCELEPYAYIAPHVLFFTLFTLVPIIYGVYTAFTKWDIYNEPVFVGLENFKTILLAQGNTYYGQLRNGLWNTVKFVLYNTPFGMVLPLALAMALRKVTRGNKFLQSVFYLPALMSTTTVMLAWTYFFRKTYGFAPNFFGTTFEWFAPPYSWLMLVIITAWWSNGTNMVIFQSSLASIPEDQYEAASIDGANAVQKFWYVTIPNMSYTLMYTFVTTVISHFNVYGQPNLMMGYNYEGANAVLMMYIKDTAFTQGVAGIASAMALILAAVIMVVAWIQLRMMMKDSKN